MITMSFGDFQRLIPKLCAMGLQVVVLEPIGRCTMQCPFTLEWNERARSGLPQAISLWPQAVHHPPTAARSPGSTQTQRKINCRADAQGGWHRVTQGGTGWHRVTQGDTLGKSVPFPRVKPLNPYRSAG